MSIWDAAEAGDLSEVERLVGQDPSLLDARDDNGWTPLLWASVAGHVGVVRCLLHHGAAVDERNIEGRRTALWAACGLGHTPVVRLLLDRGADPTIADNGASTSLMAASYHGHAEVVRLLLGRPSVKTSINQRNDVGRTALWLACATGRGGFVRSLLERGADPTIPDNEGTTPMAVAKCTDLLPQGVIVEDRRECVAALEVRFFSFSSSIRLCSDQLADAWHILFGA
jgi:ankyrin repeat protein